jgi:hypothetical protein
MLSTAIPRRDPERKKRILKAKIDEPSLKNWEIAAIANCSSDYVGKVLKNHRATTHQAEAAELLEPAPAGPEAAAQNPSWNFEKAVETNLAGLRAALEGGPLQQRKRPSRPSTNLLDPSRVRPITERELKANTFGYDLNSTDPNEIKRSRSWLRNHLSGGKRGSQGFVIMDAHADKDGEQLGKDQPFLINCPSSVITRGIQRSLRLFFKNCRPRKQRAMESVSRRK